MHYFEVAVTEQAMTKMEAPVGDFSWNGFTRAQGHETTPTISFFYQSKGKARRIGGDELAHEGSVSGQRGQQALSLWSQSPILPFRGVGH